MLFNLASKSIKLSKAPAFSSQIAWKIRGNIGRQSYKCGILSFGNFVTIRVKSSFAKILIVFFKLTSDGLNKIPMIISTRAGGICKAGLAANYLTLSLSASKSQSNRAISPSAIGLGIPLLIANSTIAPVSPLAIRIIILISNPAAAIFFPIGVWFINAIAFYSRSF